MPSASPKTSQTDQKAWRKKISEARGLKWLKATAEGRSDAQTNPSMLRLARLKMKRMRQVELAKHLGISESTLGQIERGHRQVKLDVAKDIALQLGVPIERLFRKSNLKKNPTKAKFIAIMAKPQI